MEQIIKDKAPKPAGLVPKNLQAFIIVGLSLLMVLIMAITGHKRPALPSPEATSSLPNLVPVNSQKVTDFQKDIEQTQRESAPQVEAALLQQQRQLASQGARPAQPFRSDAYGTPVTSTDPSGAYPPVPTRPRCLKVGEPPSDPIRDEQKKRAYQSLFSDNVALSYRRELRADPGRNPSALTTQDQLAADASAELARGEAILAQAQNTALSSQAGGLHANATPVQGAAESALPKSGDPQPSDPHFSESSEGKRHVLFEGTVLEALLINRLDGSFSGPVSCLLSSNVYSHDRQHVLIPAGSKILGEAKKVDTFGQARLAVTFHRLIMPDGFSVNLDQFKGLDQAGATSLKDKVNNHYAKIFGASLALGILGGVAQIGTASTLDATGTDRIREGFGTGMANAGEHILDQFLNILPTVTIREGTRVKVYLSNDLLLPEYGSHTIPTDI